MKKMKFTAILLSLVCVGSALVGCGGQTATTSDSANAGETTTETATGEPDADGFVGLADRTPVTLTLFEKDVTEDVEFTDPIAKKITELTGVTLKVEHAVGGDEQAIPLMIASGDYPDMIYAKGDTNKLIDAGAIIPLEDMIEEKGDNLKNLYGNMLQRLKFSQDDPSIYTVGCYGVSTALWKSDGVMQIQNAVLKDQGYPEIRTIDEYEAAMQAYKDKYPQIEGQDTIGLCLMGSDWRWLITVGNVASAAAGIFDDGEWAINDETGEAKYKYLDPNVKEYMKWLCHMNDIGLLDPESFTHQEDVYFAKLASGRVLGSATPDWGTNNAKQALISAGLEDRTMAALNITVNKDIESQFSKDPGFSGGQGIAICESSENKEKAFEFLDWMASDEAQVLVNWGIEGENYTIDENGKRVLTDEMQKQKIEDKDFVKKTGVGKYLYPFPQRGDGAVDPTGNYYSTNSPEQVEAEFTATEKETLAKYGKKLWVDFFPARESLPVSKHGQAWQFSIPSDGDLAIFNKKSEDYIKQAVTQAILGKPEDFDAAWDKILADLDAMGVQQANEQMTQYTKDTIAFWNN